MGVSVKSFLMVISDLIVVRIVSNNYEDNFLSFNCRRICQVCCHDECRNYNLIRDDKFISTSWNNGNENRSLFI